MDLARWQEFIPRGAEIALKPNLGFDLFLPGSITSPWVFEGVVRVIRDWVDKIYVGVKELKCMGARAPFDHPHVR